MNIHEAHELGRRWLAAGWLWAPGQMAIAYGTGARSVVLITSVCDGNITGFIRISGDHLDGWPEIVVPDLRDHGTLGHALGQKLFVMSDGSHDVRKTQLDSEIEELVKLVTEAGGDGSQVKTEVRLGVIEARLSEIEIVLRRITGA